MVKVQVDNLHLDEDPVNVSVSGSKPEVVADEEKKIEPEVWNEKPEDVAN